MEQKAKGERANITTGNLMPLNLTKQKIKTAICFLGLDGKSPRLYHGNKNIYFISKGEIRSFRKVFYGFKCFYEEHKLEFDKEIPKTKLYNYTMKKLTMSGNKLMDDRAYDSTIAKMNPLFITIRTHMVQMGKYLRMSKILGLNDLGLVMLGFKTHPKIKGKMEFNV